jgi:hypothetical protein
MGLTTSRRNPYHIAERHKVLGVALCKSHFYVNIIVVISERRVRWSGHEAFMGG